LPTAGSSRLPRTRVSAAIFGQPRCGFLHRDGRPPDKETLEPFVGVARALRGMGLNVPVVLACDARQGLLLLTDLGTRQYLDQLAGGRDVDRLYADALAALVRMQTRGKDAANGLPLTIAACFIARWS